MQPPPAKPDADADPLFVLPTLLEQIGELRDAHRDLTDQNRALHLPETWTDPADFAAFRATLEAIDYHTSRAADRIRHDEAFADAHVRQARMALWRAQELVAEPLTPTEQEEAWQEALGIAGDESTKDRATALLDEWGKTGARDAIAYLREEDPDA